MTWKDEAIELLLNGYNKGQISRTLAKKHDELSCLPTNVCYEKVRHYLNRDTIKEKIRQKEGIINKNHSIKNKTTYNNGITTFEIEEELLRGEEITPETIMKAKGLNPSEWKVVAFTKNVWQQQTKDGEKIDLCQSKLTVKPIVETLDFKSIEKYFKENPIVPLSPVSHKSFNPIGETLLIDIADLHSGLLAWIKEVGENYDLKTMEHRMFDCIEDILARMTENRFKKIIIASLGDILHTDNNDNKTTKGTVQQCDGRTQKAVETTLKVFTYLISECNKFAPVEYIYVPGNHDELMGYMFALALSQAFSQYDTVSFDIDPNPFKARLVGNTLLGFTHGTGSRAKDGNWLVNDFRELFGKCVVAEVHQGHLHSQAVKEQSTGVIVRTIPKLCNASAWEHLMGYRSYAAMMCFVYDDKKSLRDTWINYC